MDIHLESILDSLTSVVREIAEDVKLRAWFRGLERKNERERRNAIFAMSRRMSAFHEHPNLIHSLKLLAAPRIFEAARVTIRRERHH